MVRVINDPVTTANRLRPVLLRLARELRREIHSLGVTGGQVSLLIAIKDDARDHRVASSPSASASRRPACPATSCGSRPRG